MKYEFLYFRFTRHFFMLNVPNISDSNLKTIFGSSLCTVLSAFNLSIQQLAEPIINTAIDIYRHLSARFLPVPRTIHYMFNAIDLGKCVHSLKLADPNNFTQSLQILRLFQHECERIFCDRLSNNNDKLDAQNIIRKIFATRFDEPIVADSEQLLFADFVNVTKNKEAKSYVEIRDISKLRTVIDESLAEMNKDFGRKANLVLFQETIEHLVRLIRILRITSENGLIIGAKNQHRLIHMKRSKHLFSCSFTGNPGSGKYSLCKLAIHISGQKCYKFDVDVDKYDLRRSLVDFKTIIKSIAVSEFVNYDYYKNIVIINFPLQMS